MRLRSSKRSEDRLVGRGIGILPMLHSAHAQDARATNFGFRNHTQTGYRKG